MIWRNSFINITDSKLYWVKVISFDKNPVVLLGLKVCNYKIHNEKNMWKMQFFSKSASLQNLNHFKGSQVDEMLTYVKFGIFEKHTKFEKIFLMFWCLLSKSADLSKPWGRLFQFLCASQKVWTLKFTT